MSTSDAWDATVDFLARRETYGLAGAETAVERIDTHISSVFLAGEDVYKLKRHVRFSYVDFSTLAQREAACRAELSLNRRTAPDLYRCVRSIARANDGSLAFDGPGEVLDFVVVMRRFDEGGLFDRLAARGALDAALIERLSTEIAAFHAAAEPHREVDGRASLAGQLAGNELNLALASSDIVGAERRDDLVRSWKAELDRYGTLLQRRAEAGKVRRCHGDLHLRNICLWHDRPTLFDCIEFSDELACIDVLYDLAFLLMDLQHRELDALANLTFNAYLDRNDESDGTAALPLMLSLRAGIRAHTSVAAAQAQSDARQREACAADARAYLALAERMLHEEPVRLIAIGGLSGSGKSTLARAIGADVGRVPGARLLHTDALRKRRFGVARGERLGSDAYAPAVSDDVYRLQREEAGTALRAGRSVIVDGVFARPQERAAIAAVARQCGVAFTGLWLRAPAGTLRTRIAQRSDDMSDATVAVLAKQLGMELGEIDWTVVDAAHDPATCARATRAIVRPRVRAAVRTGT